MATVVRPIVVPGPTDRTIESITISAQHLWAIDDREGQMLTSGDDNVVYCRRPCTDPGDWIAVEGQLDQLDANDKEIWGVNDRNQVFKRSVSGRGGWTRVSPIDPNDRDSGCDPLCFSSVSVSTDDYTWGVATNNTVYMCHNCDGDNWISVDPEIILVQIDAGDEEVWGVNGSDHIFKRPVNGSGEWSIVPGRMRYISVSRGDYIWGIAPNDSLYVCEKPCTGDWQYIGGSYLEIDGGRTDEAVGLTRFNETVLLFAEAILMGKSINFYDYFVVFAMLRPHKVNP